LILPAIASVSAAALAAPDAHAQAPRPCDGTSAGSAEVARVIDGRSFILADGREVRLAAIETLLPIPGDEDEARVAAALAAKSTLDMLLAHRKVDLSVAGSGSDRYGRLTAWVFINPSSGGGLVQRELVAAGHVLVSPIPASPCRAYLQAAEHEARSRGFGLWGEPYSVVKKADDPADVLADQGRFAVVEGNVRSVRESAGIIYINFGQHRSDRFTATLLKRNEGAFTGAGVTPKALAGRTIDVRGWIEERGGPAVEVTRPEQIEIIH
jgi:endonuclease YncB( thermonuclease family)